MEPRVLCLMPTYGRRPSLLENSIQCFLDQDYNNKYLMIYDDLGTLSQVDLEHPRILIMSTTIRSANMGAKYNAMMSLWGEKFDAVCVWDDDDLYLSHHITSHVKALQLAPWSKPRRIISSYHTPPREEDASGRFHGSIAISVDYLQHLKSITGTMWVDTLRATFDQEMIKKLSDHSPTGIPDGPLSYVYRWQTSGGGHCSGLMGDPQWYHKYQPDYSLPITHLTPQYDDDTKATLRLLPRLYQ